MRSSARIAFARSTLVMAAAIAGVVANGCGSSNNNNPGSPGDGGLVDSAGGSSASSSDSGSGSSSSDASSDASSSSASSSSSSSSASSSSSSSDAGADAGGCVFETLVTGLITNPPSTPVPCSTALCGCTDNGMLITTVAGSF